MYAYLALRRGAFAACAAASLACAPGARADEAAAPAPAASAAPASTSAPAIDAAPVVPAWTLAALPDAPAPFHGIVNMDNAGHGSGAMFYPVGNLGLLGLLVGVATHAAIEAGTRSSQEVKMQADADKVLEPYAGALAGLRLRELQERALERGSLAAGAHLRPVGETPAGELQVQLAPAYALTPDAAAMVLDAVVVLGHAASTDTPVTRTVRVVSAPLREADLRAAWSANGGALLKSTAVQLMADSLDVVLAQSRRPADDKGPARTVRYQQGDVEKMERAQVLEETCARLVVRTLRGDLMVVPQRPAATLPAGCPVPEPLPARATAAGSFDPAGTATPPPAAASAAVAAK